MHRGGRGRAPQRVTNQAAKDRFLGDRLGGAVFGELEWIYGTRVSSQPAMCQPCPWHARSAGATSETLNECTTGLVFGLPNSNWSWVQHVKKG